MNLLKISMMIPQKMELWVYKNNTLAAYAHVHFFGNMDFVRNLFNR